MKTSQEANISKIERGRTATIIEGAIGEFLVRMEDSLIIKMVQAYRADQVTHDRAIGWIAELASIDNLRQTLRSEQTQANVAASREYANGR